MRKIEGSTTISEGKDQLLDIKTGLPEYMPRRSYGFTGGHLRKCMAELFEEGAEYTFMRTVVNPEASDLIGTNSDMLVEKRFGPRGVGEFHERFNADLMDTYIHVLCKLVEMRKIPHVHYPLVRNDGVHNLERHPDQPLWPLIHVVRGDPSEFIALTKNLNSDEAYAIAKEREAPQDYRRGAIDLLHDSGIEPCVLEDRVWSVDADTLRNSIDFLTQFTHSHTFRDTCLLDD